MCGAKRIRIIGIEWKWCRQRFLLFLFVERVQLARTFYECGNRSIFKDKRINSCATWNEIRNVLRITLVIRLYVGGWCYCCHLSCFTWSNHLSSKQKMLLILKMNYRLRANATTIQILAEGLCRFAYSIRTWSKLYAQQRHTINSSMISLSSDYGVVLLLFIVVVIVIELHYSFNLIILYFGTKRTYQNKTL